MPSFFSFLRQTRDGVRRMRAQPLPIGQRAGLVVLEIAAQAGYFAGTIIRFPSNHGRLAQKKEQMRCSDDSHRSSEHLIL